MSFLLLYLIGQAKNRNGALQIGLGMTLGTANSEQYFKGTVIQIMQ